MWKDKQAAISCGNNSYVLRTTYGTNLKIMRIVPLKNGCKSNGTGESVRINILTHIVPVFDPRWKVCIAQQRYRPRNFDAFYMFTITFSKSQARNFQTFQSGV
jgi:hypothetical protein